MPSYHSDFLNLLHERGFIHQISNARALDEVLKKGVVPAYIGFDCTAPSLHVGSLVQIMMLYWLQKCGHKPIVLMGGGTSCVGDPSGKDESRKALSFEEIQTNKQGLQKVFSSFLTFGEDKNDALMVDNAEWLRALNYIDFLRECGRHFSVNQMIQRDSVKMRLEREQHLSFLEFNYMVLQAYDFVELNKRYQVRLQLGGSDQWGNIISGIDLARRMEGAELYALTTPLLTTASGTKMGKTASGAVWLNEDHLPAYDYWQFWRNCEDQDVGRFLKLFTALPLDEIKRLEALGGADINEAKKVLATEATMMLHGKEAAFKAEATATKTFEAGQTSQDLPSIDISQSQLDEGLGLLNAGVLAGLASSNGEMRRHVQSGAIKINNVQEKEMRRQLTKADVTKEGFIKLSMGKKKHILLRVMPSRLGIF